MANASLNRRSPKELLDLAIANVVACPHWSLARLQPLAPASICVTEVGYFINYSIDEASQTDGILVRGSSMWITGDMWKSLLFGSRMVLPAAVEDGGQRWLRCDARFGRAKIGDEADPAAALKVVCTWNPMREAQSSSESGGYLLTGESSSVELVEDPRAGLIVSKVTQNGADHVAIQLDGSCVLPDPAPDDTLDRDEIQPPKATRKRSSPGRQLDIELRHDEDADESDFAWVVTSYDIIDAVGLGTGHDIEDLLQSQGLLGDGLSNDVIFDSSGDQLIAFCRTRKAGDRLVAALRSLT